jgi:hypothetical protein
MTFSVAGFRPAGRKPATLKWLLFLGVDVSPCGRNIDPSKDGRYRFAEG